MFDSHRGQKIFSLPRVVPCFPLLGLTPSGLFMGLSSTITYTSELIFCSTICRYSMSISYFQFLVLELVVLGSRYVCEDMERGNAWSEVEKILQTVPVPVDREIKS